AVVEEPTMGAPVPSDRWSGGSGAAGSGPVVPRGGSRPAPPSSAAGVDGPGSAIGALAAEVSSTAEVFGTVVSSEGPLGAGEGSRLGTPGRSGAGWGAAGRSGTGSGAGCSLTTVVPGGSPT